jgi:hypothetical protein
MTQAVPVTFPSIVPSQREFTLGQFPTKTYRALSGATVKRSFGSRPSGYRLTLVFQNIRDSITKQLLDHYETTGGGFARFELPAAVFSGMSVELRGLIRDPDGIRWEYTGPPAVQSIFSDISTVTIELQGEQNL